MPAPLAFVPTDTDGYSGATIGTTALKDVLLFDGTPAANASASNISLNQAKTVDSNGDVVDALELLEIA